MDDTSARHAGTRIILLFACIVAIAFIAIFARRPLTRPALARVREGDIVATQSGDVGIVLERRGGRALVAFGALGMAGADRRADLPTGAVNGIWIRASLLSAAPAGSSVPPPLGAVYAHPPIGIASPRPTKFERLGAALHDGRATVLTGAAIILVLVLPLSGTVSRALSTGGFTLTGGEAQQVEQRAHDEFGAPASQLVILLRGVDTVDPDRPDEPMRQLVSHLNEVSHIAGIGPPKLSKDGSTAMLEVGLDSTDDTEMATALDGVRSSIARAGYVRSDIAGRAVFAKDVNGQMQRDLRRAELIGIPVALLVLLIVFGTVPAALVALTMGAVAVSVALGVIHLLALGTQMSVFVFNVTALLGLGLGIDYSMLMIDRFRRELASRGDVRAASAAATGKVAPAILVSGLAIGTGLLGLLAFDLPALRSIALGSAVVVTSTMVCCILLLPAVLARLGAGIERWSVRSVHGERSATMWRGIARTAMRHPGVVVLVVGGLALAVATPALDAKLELANPAVLPADSSSRIAQRNIESRFPVKVASPLLVLVEGGTIKQRLKLEQRLSALKGVATASEPVRLPGRSLVLVTSEGDPQGGPSARALVGDLRAINSKRESGGPRLTVGGRTASEQEFLGEMRRGLPAALAVVFGSTFFVLLFAFRSIIIPIKAILLDVLSISATLGIVVLVSNAGLLGAEAAQWMDASLPLLLFCLLFGLSMDYEVFMLARITENWQQGMSSDDATVDGLAAVAPMITGAAMILVVFGVAFATTELVLVRQIGFGVATALLLDATVVRGLLVPAVMRLMGDRNWWVPPFLARRMPITRWS